MVAACDDLDVDFRLKTLAWNLNHRTTQKVVPPTVVGVLDGLDVDIALFNEFVERSPREAFRQELSDRGYVHQLVSFSSDRHNRVLAASRVPIGLGDLKPPSMNGTAVASMLHLLVDGTNLEIIGLRVPAYTTAAKRSEYRAELNAILHGAQGRAIVVAGDFNEDPFRPPTDASSTAVPFKGVEMFAVTNPIGDWSYMNSLGTKTSRIDHVMHAGAVRIDHATYCYEVDGIHLAGPKDISPISDHAALVFTIEPTR